MDKAKVTPISFAMESGLYLGLYNIIQLGLLILICKFWKEYFNLFSPLSFLLFFLSIFFHILLYKSSKKFRNEVLDGSISFFEGWNVSILTYFFSGLISGAFIFFYTKFFDSRFIIELNAQIIKLFYQFTNYFSTPNNKIIILTYIKDLSLKRLPSEIEMAINQIRGNISIGFFISLIISAILIRKKKI
ncbi:MAG: DUF4199 domain-containing protein [Bacteroidales bacterium]